MAKQALDDLSTESRGAESSVTFMSEARNGPFSTAEHDNFSRQHVIICPGLSLVLFPPIM